MDKISDGANKTLRAANATVLVAYLFVFQIPKLSPLISICLTVSFSLYIVSLAFFTWHSVRYPLRKKIFDENKDRTVNKHSERIAAFLETMILPLSVYKYKEEMVTKLAAAKTEQERKAIIKAEDGKLRKKTVMDSEDPDHPEYKTIDFVVESMLHQFAGDSRNDYDKAFVSPLDEKHAKIKCRIDRLAAKYRIQVFVAATIFLIIAVFIKLLSL